MIKNILLSLSLLLATLTIHPSSVEAQRGCCSWHGGISHCDSSAGTYVCNDGTYSPSCSCGGGGSGGSPTYFAPAPVKDPLDDVKGTAKFNANTDGTYDVEFDWDYVTSATGFSIAMTKTKGGDPGPAADTVLSTHTFKNMKPGTYYVNLKALAGGRWTGVHYWEVTVPTWYPPAPDPTYEPITLATEEPIRPLEQTGGGAEIMLALGSIVLVFLALAQWGIKSILLRTLQASMMTFSFLGITFFFGGMMWGITGTLMPIAYKDFDAKNLSFWPFYIAAVAFVGLYVLHYWNTERLSKLTKHK